MVADCRLRRKQVRHMKAQQPSIVYCWQKYVGVSCSFVAHTRLRVATCRRDIHVFKHTVCLTKYRGTCEPALVKPSLANIRLLTNKKVLIHIFGTGNICPRCRPEPSLPWCWHIAVTVFNQSQWLTPLRLWTAARSRKEICGKPLAAPFVRRLVESAHWTFAKPSCV